LSKKKTRAWAHNLLGRNKKRDIFSKLIL